MLLSKNDIFLSKKEFTIKLVKLLLNKQITKDQYQKGLDWWCNYKPSAEEIEQIFGINNTQ